MTDHISADLLQGILDEVRDDSSGELVPHLGDYEHPNPDALAMAVCDLEGTVTSAGDDDIRFDLQSASKPFVYALALDQKGVDEVAKRIGVEPSGDAFNEISLEAGTGRAPNGLVNAGALAAHALVGDTDDDEVSRFEHIRALLSRLVGRDVEVDEEIADIEAKSAHRNQALAHLLAEEGTLADDPHEVVAGYGRQCAVRVDVRELAHMAAMFANGGLKPGSDERILGRKAVRYANSVMFTCGMYDAAGDWVYQVGLPAKSGVSGCLFAVVPGKFGIAAYSPRLDEHGNSVRAAAAIEQLSDRFDLHVLDHVRGDGFGPAA
ncbi:MAG: glutaminase A [Dietzia sp.]|nr:MULTISPECIES: glutaminase A [Dietzia]MBB1034193.1 glutaminase A [Dietzia sp. CQ4]MBB1039057.1 glutaminase A [Dietzia natronolimnaea]MBB1048595.1 glutaminase A [Dietzia cercidiphylli]MBB1051726.1 glutaminase A [Dietzia sp. CW19]MBB1054070.1 glutaminase A [Dietzia sp. B44]